MGCIGDEMLNAGEWQIADKANGPIMKQPERIEQYPCRRSGPLPKRNDENADHAPAPVSSHEAGVAQICGLIWYSTRMNDK